MSRRGEHTRNIVYCVKSKLGESRWIKSVKICRFKTLWQTAFFSRVLLRNEKMSLFIYLFIYLLNFAIHTDINKWQGHHNSVHQLLWALLKLSNTVNLRIQLNLSQYNITRYNTIRYNTCTIQYITTEYNIIARTRLNFHRHYRHQQQNI